MKLCAYKKCIATCCMEIHAVDYKLSGSSKKHLYVFTFKLQVTFNKQFITYGSL